LRTLACVFWKMRTLFLAYSEDCTLGLVSASWQQLIHYCGTVEPCLDCRGMLVMIDLTSFQLSTQ
jgi:hypothetical protein